QGHAPAAVLRPRRRPWRPPRPHRRRGPDQARRSPARPPRRARPAARRRSPHAGVQRRQARRPVLEAARQEPPLTVPDTTLPVFLAQALAKGDRGELAVELATEAGVDAIVPWRAARSVAKWEDGGRGDKALARWRATARAAAKQARRAHVPDVTEPAGTREL